MKLIRSFHEMTKICCISPTGYLYDVYGNYFLAFLLAGIPPFIGAAIMIPIVVMQRRQQKQREGLLESVNKQETWTPYS